MRVLRIFADSLDSMEKRMESPGGGMLSAELMRGRDLLSKEIKRLRKEHGWSLEEVARRLHVPVSLVESWETGDAPSTECLIGLAGLFGVTTDYLLGLGGDSISLEGLTEEERGLLRRLADYLGKRGKS